CKFYIGQIENGRNGIDIYQANGGWVNENIFFGGSFRVCTNNRTESRFAYRIRSNEGYTNSDNKFIGPSFELYGHVEGALTRPVYMENGFRNVFTGCRFEPADGNSSTNPNNFRIFATELNNSGQNEYHVQFSTHHLTLQDGNG